MLNDKQLEEIRKRASRDRCVFADQDIPALLDTIDELKANQNKALEGPALEELNNQVDLVEEGRKHGLEEAIKLINTAPAMLLSYEEREMCIRICQGIEDLMNKDLTKGES